MRSGGGGGWGVAICRTMKKIQILNHKDCSIHIKRETRSDKMVMSELIKFFILVKSVGAMLKSFSCPALLTKGYQ